MIENPDFQTRLDQDQSLELQELDIPEGELHLRFYVASGDEFAMPATAIRRIIENPPDRITPVPNVSPMLLGTLNEQGRVIWVADLGQFLGYSQSMSTDRTEIPVIAVEDQGTMLGLAVNQIVGTDWLDIDSLQMSRNYPDVMAPFLKGEWMIDQNGHRSLRLLDHIAILRSARWAA
jgi:twitching motility protein PilI